MMNLFVENYGKLISDCLVIAIETIGMVKFLDNFLFPKKDLTLRKKCGLELIICVICAYMNSHYTNNEISLIYNLFTLSLSLTQLAYDCIVHGIPKFLEKMFGMNHEKKIENEEVCEGK